MTPYSAEIEAKMVTYYSSLPEKSARHYAALESLKLGYGGQSYISRLFGIGIQRIQHGLAELENPNLLSEIPEGKQRRPGGGRKKRRNPS